MSNPSSYEQGKRCDSTRPVIVNSIGHFAPDHVLENSFFSELGIGSDEDFIWQRTGIVARRSVLSKEQIRALNRGETDFAALQKSKSFIGLDEMAAYAWDNCSIKSEHPDLVICGTSCPDFDIPANACVISARLNLEAPSFDLNSACSSFIFDLHAVRAMIQSGLYAKVAIFNPERYSTRMNFAERSSCILFGDGATAASVSTEGSGLLLLDSAIFSDPTGYGAVTIPISQTFWQNGRAVQKFAISKTVECSRHILDRHGLTSSDVNYFVGHQANLRMLTSVADKLGFDANQHLFNVDRFGNQGAAGAPSVLAENWQKFQKGDLILVTAVGSGLSWGSALFRRI